MSYREVSGYLGSVLTISDQNRVLWRDFVFGKKVPPRFYHRSNLLVLVSPNFTKLKSGQIWFCSIPRGLLYKWSVPVIWVLDCCACGIRRDYRRHAKYDLSATTQPTAHGTAGTRHSCTDHHLEGDNLYILSTIACVVAALLLR